MLWHQSATAQRVMAQHPLPLLGTLEASLTKLEAVLVAQGGKIQIAARRGESGLVRFPNDERVRISTGEEAYTGTASLSIRCYSPHARNAEGLCQDIAQRYERSR
jgi:hypothetical protein